jgi:hypothetical protein
MIASPEANLEEDRVAMERRRFIRLATAVPVGLAGWLGPGCARDGSLAPGAGAPSPEPKPGERGRRGGTEGQRRHQRPAAPAPGSPRHRPGDHSRSGDAAARRGVRAGLRRAARHRAVRRPRQLPGRDPVRARRPRPAALRDDIRRAALARAARARRPGAGRGWPRRLPDTERARALSRGAPQGVCARAADPVLRRAQVRRSRHHRGP